MRLFQIGNTSVGENWELNKQLMLCIVATCQGKAA